MDRVLLLRDTGEIIHTDRRECVLLHPIFITTTTIIHLHRHIIIHHIQEDPTIETMEMVFIGEEGTMIDTKIEIEGTLTTDETTMIGGDTVVIVTRTMIDGCVAVVAEEVSAVVEVVIFTLPRHHLPTIDLTDADLVDRVPFHTETVGTQEKTKNITEDIILKTTAIVGNEVMVGVEAEKVAGTEIVVDDQLVAEEMMIPHAEEVAGQATTATMRGTKTNHQETAPEDVVV